jgi:hypothetical protein
MSDFYLCEEIKHTLSEIAAFGEAAAMARAEGSIQAAELLESVIEGHQRREDSRRQIAELAGELPLPPEFSRINGSLYASLRMTETGRAWLAAQGSNRDGSVHFSGDDIAIDARLAENLALTETGRAYLERRAGTVGMGATGGRTLEPAEASPGTACFGDDITIDASLTESLAATDTGRAYLARRGLTAVAGMGG